MKTQVNFKFKVKFYNFFQNSPIIISTCETHIFQKMAVIFFLVNIIKKIFRWDIRHIKLHKFHIEHIFWKCLYFREFWKYPFAYNYFPHCSSSQLGKIQRCDKLKNKSSSFCLKYYKNRRNKFSSLKIKINNSLHLHQTC